LRAQTSGRGGRGGWSKKQSVVLIDTGRGLTRSDRVRRAVEVCLSHLSRNHLGSAPGTPPHSPPPCLRRTPKPVPRHHRYPLAQRHSSPAYDPLGWRRAAAAMLFHVKPRLRIRVRSTGLSARFCQHHHYSLSRSWSHQTSRSHVPARRIPGAGHLDTERNRSRLSLLMSISESFNKDCAN
jgi:hypothetical protein